VKLSVVTTIYRTSGAIAEFHRRASAVAIEIGCDLELIFVNDGSPDDGLEVARKVARQDPRVIVIDLSRNFGQHRALWTGMEHATGNLVAIFDGDLEEDPAWLIEFHRLMNETESDVVYGVQRDPKGRAVYRGGRKVFYSVLNTLAAIEFPTNVVTARLMTRRYVDALLRFEERELFLVGLMHMAGFVQTATLVDKPKLTETKYTFRRLFWLFLNAVTAFSTAPLAAIFLAGIGLSLGALAFIGLLVFRYYWFGVGVEGWTSVMAAVVFFSGVLLFFNGVMAIYIGTIFMEVKRRPLSIVRTIHRGGDGV